MSDSEGDASTYAVVLDFLAHGRQDGGGPGYGQSPVGYAVGEESFRLFELGFAEGTDVSIGDRVAVDPTARAADIESVREIEYEDLSGGAQSELEYVIEEIVEDQEDRFVEFFNDAQPITLRLHQLNLLPGIGKKLRNGILDARKREAFDSFEDLEERIAGLHDPKGVIAERILEELQTEDLKYRIFARREE